MNFHSKVHRKENDATLKTFDDQRLLTFPHVISFNILVFRSSIESLSVLIIFTKEKFQFK